MCADGSDLLRMACRRRGIDARKNHIRPVGAWFSQVGRLHEVHHIWQHASLEQRKATREEAWKAPGWSETVTKASIVSDALYWHIDLS